MLDFDLFYIHLSVESLICEKFIAYERMYVRTYICMYVFFIVACSITGSTTSCLNVMFTIKVFRNHYINCCTL